MICLAERRKGVKNVGKKNYGVISIVGLLFCSIAAGAFGVEEMVSTSGPGLTMIVLFVMVFIWAIPWCFCVTEVGSVLPAEGGDQFHRIGSGHQRMVILRLVHDQSGFR